MASYGELSDEQLIHRVLEHERDLVEARFRHSMNQLENTARLRALRREIARLRTEARQREARQGAPNGQLMQAHRASLGAKLPDASQPAVGKKGGFLSGIVDKLSGNE